MIAYATSFLTIDFVTFDRSCIRYADSEASFRTTKAYIYLLELRASSPALFFICVEPPFYHCT